MYKGIFFLVSTPKSNENILSLTKHEVFLELCDRSHRVLLDLFNKKNDIDVSQNVFFRHMFTARII